MNTKTFLIKIKEETRYKIFLTFTIFYNYSIDVDVDFTVLLFETKYITFMCVLSNKK